MFCEVNQGTFIIKGVVSILIKDCRIIITDVLTAQKAADLGQNIILKSLPIRRKL